MRTEPTTSEPKEASEPSRKGRVVVLVLAVAAIVAILVLFMDDDDKSRRPPEVAVAAQPGGPPGHPHYALNVDDEHVKKVEASLAPLTARFVAEPGATPCESGFNGLQAFLDADVDKHNTTFALPERTVFLDKCTTALTDQEQQCLSASYQAGHREICEPIYKEITAKLNIQVLSDGPPH